MQDRSNMHGGARRALAALALIVGAALAACGGGNEDDAETAADDAAAQLDDGQAYAMAVAQTAQVRIEEQSAGRCLGVSGTTLQWQACSTAPAQRFQALPISAGSSIAMLRHVDSNLCIGVAGASRQADAAVELQACQSGARHQRFARKSDTMGNVQLQARHSSRCLRVTSEATTPLRQQACDPTLTVLTQLFELAAESTTPPPPPPPPPPSASWWQPSLMDTWQWQLSGQLNTSYDVKVYDIDLFDTPAPTIAALKAQGRRVVCYFSGGSSEDWRPDYSRFAAADKGNPLDPIWVGERWLDTRSANVRAIMRERLDLARQKGCDGVEPDNVDGYTNNPGFALTAQTQLDYNRFLADEAHARGLAIGLKNDTDQLAALEPYFDFAVNEQCHEYSTGSYNECAGYSVFTTKGKPVFNAEYRNDWATSATERARLCDAARAANLRTIVYPIELNDRFRYACD